MDLKDLRLKIDSIDNDLIRLFEERLDVAADIARYKKQHGLPVFDPDRENQKLRDISSKVKEDQKANIAEFFSLLFKISRAEQEKILNTRGDL